MKSYNYVYHDFIGIGFAACAQATLSLESDFMNAKLHLCLLRQPLASMLLSLYVFASLQWLLASS
jgi:hypothetical protein